MEKALYFLVSRPDKHSGACFLAKEATDYANQVDDFSLGQLQFDCFEQALKLHLKPYNPRLHQITYTIDVLPGAVLVVEDEVTFKDSVKNLLSQHATHLKYHIIDRPRSVDRAGTPNGG